MKITQLNSFDDVLNYRIKFGKYQIISYLFLILIDFGDGMQIITMSLIMPIIKNEWQLSSVWLQILTSAFGLGMFFGAITSGKYADMYGRRKTLIYSSIVQFFVNAAFFLIHTKFYLLIGRFLQGFFLGFTLPISLTMISEIMTVDLRGKFVAFGSFSITLGKLFNLGVAWLIFENLTHGNWRLLVFYSSIPSLITCFGFLIFIYESPRFLLSHQRFPEAFMAIDKMGTTNSGPLYHSLSNREKASLTAFYTIDTADIVKPSLTSLLDDKNFDYTWRLWIIWFTLLFIDWGQLIILPFVLGDSQHGFADFAIALLGEFPSLFIAMALIDNKAFGRKNTMTLCIVSMCMMQFFCYFSSKTTLIYFLFFFMLFSKLCHLMLCTMTTEAYDTNHRASGYGTANSLGRMGATIAPYILFPVYKVEPSLAFAIFSFMSFINIWISDGLPSDMTGKNLDEKENKKKI